MSFDIAYYQLLTPPSLLPKILKKEAFLTNQRYAFVGIKKNIKIS